ncbi:MAG: hypothetical protein NWF00_07830 [Candidatus Bathyarchaeota archaeon]|nr:hypothetical protein [Candidatus Bathyarchaeota archaeon]
MQLKALEEIYLLQTDVAKSAELIEQALNEVGLKNVAVKKFVPPRYLLVQYSPSWVGKALEIEFLFTPVEGGTELAIKWPYTRELLKADEDPHDFRREQEQARQKIEQLIGEFRKKIGATKIPNGA